jgi:plasmid stability protein
LDIVDINDIFGIIDIIMASLLIRRLDDALKRQLRLRAAQNGRSMEEEVRQILRHALGVPAPEDVVETPPPAEEGRAASRPAPQGPGRVRLFGRP